MKGKRKLIATDEQWRRLGDHLYRLRLHYRLPQKDIADTAGISEYTYRTIENHVDGKGHTRKTLEKVSLALDQILKLRLNKALGKDYLYNQLLNPAPDDFTAEPLPLRGVRARPSRPEASRPEASPPEAGPEPPPEAGPQPPSVLEKASELELLMPRINQLMVARLNEIVMPQLNQVNERVDQIYNIIQNTGSQVDIAMDQHPAAPE
jgi:transcriptional regulator with XRE-family HTH domain